MKCLVKIIQFLNYGVLATAYEVPNIPGVSKRDFEQAKSDFGCEITEDNVDEFMKELDLLSDPGLCR